MIPTAKIRVFGKLQIWDQRSTFVKLPTKKTEALLATLLIANGPRSRADLAEEIWPDTSPEKARLSLRTALAQIRKLLGPELIESQEERVELDRNTVDSDFYQARRLHRLITITKSGIESRNYQEQLAELIARPLLEGIPGDYFESERTTWLNLRKSTLLELADARLASGLNESALIAATSALKIDRLDEKSLTTTLIILAQLGKIKEALKLSLDTAKLFRKELNLPLPKSLIDLTAEIKTGKITPGSQPHNLFNESIEKEMIVAMVESTISRDPDAIFQIFCDESFNSIAVENLPGYVAILEKALHQTTGNSAPRIRAARMVARTAMMMSDYPKCFEWAKVVINNTDENSQIHIATLDFLASAYFNLQDYALAEELSIRAYELAEIHGFPVERNSAFGNLTSYRFNQLKLESVLTNYEKTLALVLQENASPFRVCSVYCQIAVYHLYTQNYEETITTANKGINVIKGSSYYLNGSNYCTRAVAQAKQGNWRDAISSAIEGLSISFGGNSIGVTFACLEYCCQVLAIAGSQTAAIWISEATNILRIQTGFPRTPLLDSLAALENYTNDINQIAQATASNRLNHQELPTLVEFTLDELNRAFDDI
jgi:DNA-binding SARP family transcriptional activator